VFCRSHRRGQEEGGKLWLTPTFPAFCAAAHGENAPPLFIQVQKVSQHFYGFLGVCFVILKCLM
jgi:hypothetical protein